MQRIIMQTIYLHAPKILKNEREEEEEERRHCSHLNDGRCTSPSEFDSIEIGQFFGILLDCLTAPTSSYLSFFFFVSLYNEASAQTKFKFEMVKRVHPK